MSRNPYFIGINSAMEASKRETDGGDRVAILILLELTLQLKEYTAIWIQWRSRNPYFIGINSAIIF